MLKIARSDEERRGAAVMVWYDGDGAVRVLETNGAALLLERPQTLRSLAEMSAGGSDDEATRILCAPSSGFTRRSLVRSHRILSRSTDGSAR